MLCQKKFVLSSGRNDLKVAFCKIDLSMLNIYWPCSLRFHPCHDCSFLVFVSLATSCAGSMASNSVPSLSR